MQNENNKKRFAGKGYYIALIACITAVGISGYVFVRTARSSAQETVETVAMTTVAASPSASASASAPASSSPSAAAKAAETDQMEDAYEETMAEAAVDSTADSTADSAVAWPLEGDVLAVFSRDALIYSQTMADWRTHEGLDIAAEGGSLVCATQDGTVTAVYDDDYLGTVVVVSHSGDLATVYANLAETPSVAVGDTVSAGEVIGQVGDTALLETADPSHLHFEVYENGVAVDPLDYLPE